MRSRPRGRFQGREAIDELPGGSSTSTPFPAEPGAAPAGLGMAARAERRRDLMEA